MDLSEVAENAIEEVENTQSEQEVESKENDEQQNIDPEETEETSEADDSEESEESEESESEEDEDSSESEERKEDKQAQELSDDELLAELEKRGLNKQEEKQEKQPEQPRSWDRKPAELPNEVWEQMDASRRYIYNNLPYLEARGKDGTVLKIKTRQQIPADFEWINDAAKERFFGEELPAQIYRAERLNDSIQKQYQSRQQEEQQHRYDRMIVDGVEELQKQGIVPKITTDSRSPDFAKDPGVQRAEEVLNLWMEFNQKGERISIATAGQIFKMQHPELYQVKKTKSSDDKRRKKASRNISGGSKNTASEEMEGPVFPPGTSLTDIAEYYGKDLD